MIHKAQGDREIGRCAFKLGDAVFCVGKHLAYCVRLYHNEDVTIDAPNEWVWFYELRE